MSSSKAEKEKLVQITSPRGRAVYPKLQKPDTKYKVEGEFSIKLAVPEEQAAPFIQKLTEIHKEAYKAECARQKKPKLKMGEMPWKDEEDGEGNPTGCVIFKASQLAKITSKKTGETFDKRIVLFDGANNPFPKDRIIGSGSEVKLCADVKPYFTPTAGFGIKLRLKAVQVLKLVEFVPGSNPEGYGFGADGEPADSGAADDYADTAAESQEEADGSAPGDF